MPIYEYRREDGTTFEVMQKFSDPALEVDPDTGQKVRRVLSAPAIHFKGSGFHNTDYGTAKRRRELDRAASDGADKHDDKMASQRKEREKVKTDAAKAPSTSTSTSSSSTSSSSSDS